MKPITMSKEQALAHLENLNTAASILTNLQDVAYALSGPQDALRIQQAAMVVRAIERSVERHIAKIEQQG